ncbi:MAG: 1-acyl-sn-glycerol-3-phosphate acyltransferase [Clostridia bacterium]|nr:1-acyl-sn-glycerol-3-phosphate acyltransferase [Clostridia bacterium]
MGVKTYRAARAVTNFLALILYRVSYFGRENDTGEGNCIVLSNHTSFTDPVFTANAVKKRDLVFIAKESLTGHGLFGKFLLACNVLPIRRGESDIQALRSACGTLSEGKSLGIYPQGTRMPGKDPEPSQAMAGIGLMASRSKADLLPVAICYGKNRRGKPCVFRKVRVYVGKPVPYSEYSAISERPNSHEIAEYAFGKVCDLFNEHNDER